MGSDDIFKKRKAQASAAFERKKRDVQQNKRFLIVCEGTKTEPHYLRELVDDLRIRPQLVHIVENNGTSPDRVVAHALDLYEKEALLGDAYDKAYCVFDRDKHDTFDTAIARIKDLSAAGKPLEAITSTPCFEFWLLLHFGYTDQPFHAAGKKSVGDQAVASLKKKPGFGNYGKGQKGLYTKLKHKLDDALCHAKSLRANNKASRSTNPATDIDRLILELRKLATRS